MASGRTRDPPGRVTPSPAAPPERGVPPRGVRIRKRDEMTASFADELTSEDLPPEEDPVLDHPYYQPEPGMQGPDDADFDFLDVALAEFLKRPKTQTAREYEKKTKALLNSAMRFTITNSATVPDAAAIIVHGSAFAAAAGVLADEDKKAARLLDVICTPGNPYVMFAMAAIPLFTQLARNHEPQIAHAAQTRKERRAARKAGTPRTPRAKVNVTIPIIKRTIGIPVGFKLKFYYFKGQTIEPQALAQGVFSNEKVLAELKKRGIDIAAPRG